MSYETIQIQHLANMQADSTRVCRIDASVEHLFAKLMMKKTDKHLSATEMFEAMRTAGEGGAQCLGQERAE